MTHTHTHAHTRTTHTHTRIYGDMMNPCKHCLKNQGGGRGKYHGGMNLFKVHYVYMKLSQLLYYSRMIF
jgi:hypothetical protein